LGLGGIPGANVFGEEKKESEPGNNVDDRVFICIGKS